ncbi:HlyD family efflux transporter periplasmic adaptor subunit [Polynucleobacter hirudinilacicola]|nr:HlyD family efflux transporter periplasmic adaptor subunit [Polynucleobacter hirudinilacicola]
MNDRSLNPNDPNSDQDKDENKSARHGAGSDATEATEVVLSNDGAGNAPKTGAALVVAQATDVTKNAVMKLADGYAEWHDIRTGDKDERYFSWLGWQVLIWGMGILLLWAIFAPLEKGVSASGFVITDSNRQAIQPAFAGIVEDIYVKEGQQVKAGEVLIKLNPTNALAQKNSTQEVIGGLDAQSKGLEQSIVQKKQQSALLEKQLIGLRELVAEGYMARNKVFDLERQQLQLKGSILEDEGNLVRLKRQISEQKEKLTPFEMDLANTELKSPVNGQVVNMTVFTKGGVVSPGQKIMEVIPSNEALIVEGQLPVHLVDKVHVDLPVEMMFTAFNANRTPHIPGTLISVGADRIVDEKTGQPYYKIQAVTTAKGAKMLKDYKVRPGMPVELFVKTGEQSMMTYMLKPIFDRTHSALREE